MYDCYRFNDKTYHVGIREVQKSIRIDEESRRIIDSLPGRSFSDKIVYLAYHYQYGMSKKGKK